MMLKRIKKIFIVLNLFFLMLPILEISVKANEVPILKANGNGYVTYLGTDIKVMIPDTYEVPETSFRAVWVSAFAGDISSFLSEAQYKEEITNVLNTLDYYNINVMIFHVRVRNDAFYESKYNKWSSYYNTNPSWDALPWIIDECHKRGIEFHAWLNPYRVSSTSSNLEEIAKKFKATNPASNPKNLLKGEDVVILNPGLPNVRKFLINTCMELVENYNIDAIHFDDFFYEKGIDDSETYALYNLEGLSLEDWRREQINLFIKGLSSEMRQYNEKTGRRVQLGIAPTGAWKSAGSESYVEYDENGNAISNGASTSGTSQHYESHWYADTLKWINEEWIDYILPQTYWALEHSLGSYADLVKWWAQVVKYKKVNLYVSLGLYMRNEDYGSSWVTNDLEGYNQIMYGSNYDTVKGYSVYKYSFLKASSKGSDKGFKKVNELWSKPAILPEIRTMDKIIIDNPKKLSVGKVQNGYKLEFEEVEKAKFYVIYRSENELEYSSDEVIDIIGNNSYDGIVNYVDLISNDKNYYYGVRAQSNSLTLTEGISVNTNYCNDVSPALIEKVDTIITSNEYIENTTMDVKWKKIYQNIGGEVKYELYYSYDGENWLKNEKEITIDNVSGYVLTELKLESGYKKIYFKIKAFNDFGESFSDIQTFDIYKKFDSVNHFSIIGATYSGETVEFVWNNLLNYNNVKYTIQESLDGIVFNDVKDVENNDKVNNRVEYVLPKKTCEMYFRIKAEVDGQIGYSKELLVKIRDKVENIDNYLVNSKDAKEYYVLNEGDILEISYTNSEQKYVPRLSRDGKNWILASKFYPENSIEVNNNTYKQKIYISGTDLKIYFCIEVNNENLKSETEKIEIYVIPEYVYYDELISFMEKEQNSILSKTNMFN